TIRSFLEKQKDKNSWLLPLYFPLDKQEEAIVIVKLPNSIHLRYLAKANSLKLLEIAEIIPVSFSHAPSACHAIFSLTTRYKMLRAYSAFFIKKGTTSNEENIGSVTTIYARFLCISFNKQNNGIVTIQFAGTKVRVSALTGHDNIVCSFYLDVSVL
ncbi:hypothetical protein ACJX0J_009884, partial [Zea mays]